MTAKLTAPSDRILLRGISWKTYRGLIRDLESEPGKRLTYDRETLEIMVPLPPHEHFKKPMGQTKTGRMKERSESSILNLL